MAPECSQLHPPADEAVNQTTAILPLTEHFSSEKRLSGDLKLFARAWQRQGLSRPWANWHFRIFTTSGPRVMSTFSQIL